jgi:hypothetical protein
MAVKLTVRSSSLDVTPNNIHRNPSRLGASLARSDAARGELMAADCGEIDLRRLPRLARWRWRLVWWLSDSEKAERLPIWIGVVVACSCRAGAGLVNGVINDVPAVPSFITTLGLLIIPERITLHLTAVSLQVHCRGSANVQETSSRLAAAVITLPLPHIGVLLGARARAAAARVLLTWTRWACDVRVRRQPARRVSERGVKSAGSRSGQFVLRETCSPASPGSSTHSGSRTIVPLAGRGPT